jgi:S-adenosylmethionine hydrolase/catechol 2,3-dioxygenase-like lactoylglutathione lyase family enzyme
LLDHVFITVKDLDRSIAFYEKALKPLGIEHVVDYNGKDGPEGHPDLKGFGRDGRVFFWLRQGEADARSAHIGFVAKGKAEVDAFYDAATGAGAADNGKPGARLYYDPRYYAANVFDPDGYSLEAVYKSWQHPQTKVGSPRIITLLTDFGAEDYFVGAMKGVILTRSPEAVIVDITHAIPPQDVRAGAFTLSAVYGCFPAGSIHLAVVDPGVGSNRRPVIVEAAGHLFVGPDNGLFSMVLDRVPGSRVRHVTNADYFLPAPSLTFHGRDIFAPVAAALAQGVEPGQLGPVIQDPVRFEFVECESLRDGVVVGRVIHIDHFGNCVTNFAWEQLEPLFRAQPFCLHVNNHEIHELLRTYSETAALTGEPFAIIGSAGFLEISVRCASAARELKIAVGDPVKLMWTGS